ncbi:MAG: SsrA-binding protein SmpB [Eubacteriales bacterium]
MAGADIKAKDKGKNASGKKLIAQNRSARHEYFIDETYEAGISLFGTEVKSIRKGAVNLKDSYCRIINGEIFAIGVHISPYEKGNIYNRDPLRPKKLLMHRREIMKLAGLTARKGYTLIPLSLYFSGSHVKMEVGLCRGKKLYDKRESKAEADVKRELERQVSMRSSRYIDKD